MTQSYSLSRLLLSLGSNTNTRDCPELQFSRDYLEHQIGRPSRQDGALIPITASGLDSRTQGAGGFFIGTVGEEILAAVRNQAFVTRLGGQTITAAAGAVQLPTAESGTKAVWLAENSGVDAVQTDPVLGARNARPHALVSTVSYSRQLLATGTPSVEAFLRKDLARSVAVEIDRAAINGAGTQVEPVGLLQHVGVPVISIGTNGGLPTADTIYAMEESVGANNFAVSGFISTPQIRRRLRKVPKLVSGTSSPVWDDTGLLGYQSYATNNVPSTLTKGSSIGNCHAILAGDWSQLVVAIWDMEVTSDQFAQKRRGMVEVTLFVNLDVVVLRDLAFAMCVDLTLS